ncbi:MAG: C40 family peptidase, partial [Butyricicoccus sp.]
DWSRIKYGSGYGYVASEYLSSSKPSGSSVSGSSIVAAAKRMSNCTYKYGAEGPKQYDCSSFTQKAYRDCGITIPRTSISQYSQCTRVSKSNLRAGDLVFFNSEDTSSVCHVGIYMGNNQFIHAANSKRDVCTDSLNSSYYKKHFISGGRYT